MKNELDPHVVLGAFEKIKLHGEPKEDELFGTIYLLDGVRAYSDFDGYTIFLEDATVKMRFGFHNQYHLDYGNQEQAEQFEKKLMAINARKFDQ